MSGTGHGSRSNSHRSELSGNPAPTGCSASRWCEYRNDAPVNGTVRRKRSAHRVATIVYCRRIRSIAWVHAPSSIACDHSWHGTVRFRQLPRAWKTSLPARTRRPGCGERSGKDSPAATSSALNYSTAGGHSFSSAREARSSRPNPGGSSLTPTMGRAGSSASCTGRSRITGAMSRTVSTVTTMADFAARSEARGLSD